MAREGTKEGREMRRKLVIAAFWHCARCPLWLSGKEPACQRRRHRFDPWGREDPLEKGMATHFSIFAWRIPWTEEPGGLQPKGVAKESDTTE